MFDQYDVLVLGGGTAGYTAAIRSSQLGLRAAVVEHDKIGGVCLHRGCIPTKVLLESAEVLSLVRRSPVFGVLADNPRLDYARLKQRQAAVVDGLHKNLLGVLQKKKIETISGRGRLLSATTLAVETADRQLTLSARHIVLATGSRPQQLSVLPTDGRRILNSDDILALSQPPASLLIIGAGAVGLEFASFFLDLGCPVTIVEALPALLPAEDADLGAALAKVLAGRGATIHAGAQVLTEETRVGEDDVTVAIEHQGERRSLSASHLLVAVGRQGNVEAIGLEATQAKVSRGFVQVDGLLRTAEPHLLAAGDVTGHLLLAHAAAAEGFLAAEVIAGRQHSPLDYRQIPRVIYTRPQVAAIGLTEQEARDRGFAVKTQRFSFRNNSMAQIKDETEGFAKLVLERDSGRLLGAHIFGPGAVELVSEAALALQSGLSAPALAASIHPHPSLSETLNEAARLSVGVSMYW